MTSTTNRRVVLMGPGRRLTLVELSAVAHGQGLLEWPVTRLDAAAEEGTTEEATAPTAAAAAATEPTPPAQDPQPEQQEETEEDEQALLLDMLQRWTLSSSSPNDEEASSPTMTMMMMTAPQTVAFLTILALMVAQGRALVSTAPRPPAVAEATSSRWAQRLVQWVNALVTAPPTSPLATVTWPRDSTQILSWIQPTLPDVDNDWSIPLSIVQRAQVLAVTGLAVARVLELAAATLPLAALSVDVAGRAATLSYPEAAFDVARPHRAMVTAAATLRAFLNESRYQASADAPPPFSETLLAWQNIPQYQGPVMEDARVLAKTVELEMNCLPLTATTVLDETVLQLCQQQATADLTVLLRTSQARRGASVVVPRPEEENQTTRNPLWSLAELVALTEQALEEEIAHGLSRVQEITAQALAEARAKEAAKAARAAEMAHKAAAANPNNQQEDEFAGKTEEQKATILRKRAARAEKEAAKLRAKEERGGVSLFGAGTLPLCRILQESGGRLTSDCATHMAGLVEKLLSGGVQRKPKIPKGTRDYLPEQMMIRQQAFAIIRRVFQAHGAVEIDTPVFELKETLTGKYGEDSKLIYDLADQGGELLALRYDLTVPFARFLAVNSVGNIKRFHIGKVYRRDQPALKRGRYREFYQCDFDIAGTYARMVPDSECLCVVCDILDALPIGNFAVKVNHRRLLDAILDICGVPAEKFRTICSAVDKLDKEPWLAVKREMVQDKGLPEEVADQIGTFVVLSGEPWALYHELMDNKRFGDHKGAAEAMEDLRILFEYVEAMDRLKFISFDLSLARGLDYYTGPIWEAVCMSGNTQVGSIGGGGRYDNLVSMFQDAGKETPCVGVSVGIERVFTLMEARLRDEHGGTIKQPNVSVLIASAGSGFMKEKMRIARMLWNANISSEFNQQENAKLKKELPNALDRDIPFMVIIGETEMAENKCVVKDLKRKTEETIPLPDLVGCLRSKGVVPVGCEFAMEFLKIEQGSL